MNLRARGYEVIGSSRQNANGHLFLDFDQPSDQWPTMPKLKALVICAAMNMVDQCEVNVDQSFKRNVEAVKQLIRLYCSKGTQVVFFSSSHVFDGLKPFYKDTDLTHPRNVYGLHKTVAEENVLDSGGIVIRLTKVIGPKFARFHDWVHCLRSSQEIFCLDNLYTSLITLENTVRLISECIDKDKRGIIHYSGPDDKSYVEIAKLIAVNLNLDQKLILPAPRTHKYSSNEAKHTTLKNSPFVEETGICSPNTRELMKQWCEGLASD